MKLLPYLHHIFTYANMRSMNCLGIWLAFLIKSIQNWLPTMRPRATCFLTSFIQNAILHFEVTILSCTRNVVKETEMKLFMVMRANPHQPGNGPRLILSMFFPLLSVFIPGIWIWFLKKIYSRILYLTG